MEEAFKWITAIMGVMMSLSYFPQAYKIFKNKSSEDISILSYLIFGVGTIVWLLYGIYTRDIVVALGFVFGVIGSWLVIFLSLKYRNRSF